MIILNKIIWEPSSTIFSIGNFGIHYYSLMFIIAFLFGFNIMKKMYVRENVPTERLETIKKAKSVQAKLQDSLETL